MKKRNLFITLLTVTVLSLGFTFSSFAEEILVRDKDGKAVGEMDIPDELDGREFFKYYENTTIAVYGQESEVPYEYDKYLYDIYTLSPVEGGWYKYGQFSNPWNEDYNVWMYAIPGSGYLITDSWILDNGNVYLTNHEGLTRHGGTITFADVADDTTDVIYNVQTGQWEPLPFTQKGNSHILNLPYNTNITYEDFIRALSGEEYEQWKAKHANEQQNNQQTQPESNLDWTSFDIYLPQAMAERGYYSYEVLGREQINTYSSILLGTYSIGVYKVKVPDGRSHSTKYLRIYIDSDGNYLRSGF